MGNAELRRFQTLNSQIGNEEEQEYLIRFFVFFLSLTALCELGWALVKNLEPQKDAPVYGAFGSNLIVFGRANGEAAIDLQWICVIFEYLAVFAL